MSDRSASHEDYLDQVRQQALVILNDSKDRDETRAVYLDMQDCSHVFDIMNYYIIINEYDGRAINFIHTKCNNVVRNWTSFINVTPTMVMLYQWAMEHEEVKHE